MNQFHDRYAFGAAHTADVRSHELLVNNVEISYQSMEEIHVSFEFTLPNKYQSQHPLQTYTHSYPHSSPLFIPPPPIYHSATDIKDMITSAAPSSAVTDTDLFQFRIESCDDEIPVSIVVHNVSPLRTNHKWSGECSIHIADSNVNSVPIAIALQRHNTLFKYQMNVATDVDSVISTVVTKEVNRQWKINVPFDVCSVICDYCPSFFWRFGEPSVIIDTHSQLLISSFDFESIDWIWKEGFYVETDRPRFPIRCAVKCETGDNFEGAFIPTEVRPRPQTKCMLWLTEMPDPKPDKYFCQSSDSEDTIDNTPLLTTQPSSQHYLTTAKPQPSTSDTLYFNIDPSHHYSRNWNTNTLSSAMSLNCDNGAMWHMPQLAQPQPPHQPPSAMESFTSVDNAANQKSSIQTRNTRVYNHKKQKRRRNSHRCRLTQSHRSRHNHIRTDNHNINNGNQSRYLPMYGSTTLRLVSAMAT